MLNGSSLPAGRVPRHGVAAVAHPRSSAGAPQIRSGCVGGLANVSSPFMTEHSPSHSVDTQHSPLVVRPKPQCRTNHDGDGTYNTVGSKQRPMGAIAVQRRPI